MENNINLSNKKSSILNNNINNLEYQENNQNNIINLSPKGKQQFNNNLISNITNQNATTGIEFLKNVVMQSSAGKTDLGKLNYFLNSNSKNNNETENIQINEQTNIMQMRLSNFEKFIKDIKTGMSKCKYRKALEDIMTREDLFYDLDCFWRIREYKIKSMIKVLEKKIFKSDAPEKLKVKSIEMWTYKIESEIEGWIGQLNHLKTTDNNDSYEEEVEALIHVFLEELNLQAQYKFSQKLFPETFAILGLAEKIVKLFCEFSRSVKVIQSAQKISLFISSLLISDNDFHAAKAYQDITIKLAFKELFLRSDMEDGINYENTSKTNQYYLNKIFLNIINSFYQRGVCDENLGNLKKAIDSYKQAVWFSNNFVKYQFPEISQYLADVEQRAKE